MLQLPKSAKTLPWCLLNAKIVAKIVKVQHSATCLLLDHHLIRTEHHMQLIIWWKLNLIRYILQRHNLMDYVLMDTPDPLTPFTSDHLTHFASSGHTFHQIIWTTFRHIFRTYFSSNHLDYFPSDLLDQFLSDLLDQFPSDLLDYFSVRSSGPLSVQIF